MTIWKENDVTKDLQVSVIIIRVFIKVLTNVSHHVMKFACLICLLDVSEVKG